MYAEVQFLMWQKPSFLFSIIFLFLYSTMYKYSLLFLTILVKPIFGVCGEKNLQHS